MKLMFQAALVVSWYPLTPHRNRYPRCHAVARETLMAYGRPGVVQWVEVDHHRSHATLALHDSPFQRPLVVSYDGGGNDGCMHVYKTVETNDGLRQLVRQPSLDINYGNGYIKISSVLSEVSVGLERIRLPPRITASLHIAQP